VIGRHKFSVGKKFWSWKFSTFNPRKISTVRKVSENVVIKSWKFSTSKFFSDGKFVSANHILQNFLPAENFLSGNGRFKSAFRKYILFLHSVSIIWILTIFVFLSFRITNNFWTQASIIICLIFQGLVVWCAPSPNVFWPDKYNVLKASGLHFCHYSIWHLPKTQLLIFH
jgi:hypothetical protein